MNTEKNDISMWEKEQRKNAKRLAREYGQASTTGRRAVRRDKRTVVYVKGEGAQ
jgi:hypothetical protein